MRSLLHLAPYLTRHPRRLGLGLLCLLATSLLVVFIPRVVGNAVKVFDVALEAERAGEGVAGMVDFGAVWRVVWLMIGLALASGLCRFGMRKLLIDLSRIGERDFRNDIFRHLLQLSPSYYDRTMTGDLVTRLSSDMDAVRMVMGPGLMYLCQTLITIPGVVVLMWIVDPPLTLVAMVPLVLVPMITFAFANEMHSRSRAVQDQMSTLSTMVQETLSGQRVVKSFNRESAEWSKFDRINEEYVRRGLRFALIFATFFPLLHAVVGFGLLATIWMGGLRLISGAIGYGDLAAVFLWIFVLYWPLISLGWVLSLLQRGAASMDRIGEVLAERADVIGGEISEPLRGEIEFRDLTFRYPRSEKPVLDRVSIKIPRGKTLGIVGLTGSGKSTLAGLLARFYPVERGHVLIDGHDINDLPINHVRDHFGYVGQEPFLFSETIEENVRLGKAEASREEVVAAAKIAQLDDQVEGFPHGYDTMLGERGINLSGGQRQRTAIARAVLLNPPILVLDDALSAVDTDTEERILQGLRGIMAERTSLIIAHRISTVMHADEIIVIDGGRIAERGTHAELVTRGSIYADLHRRQLLEEHLEKVD
jgi:ATP-binding cassette subfamily B protein